MDYTNYTAYTDYTIAKEKEAGNSTTTLLIQRINKRTRPMPQAQPCNPVESGWGGQHRAGFCIKKSELIISDELACSTYCQC